MSYDSNTYTVTFVVENNGNGSLVAVSGTELLQTVTFTNTYAASGEGELKVRKDLTGRDWTTGDTFTFTLSAGSAELADGTTGTSPLPAATSVDIVKDDPERTKSYGTFTFDQAGTYTYIISEKTKEDDGITYDVDANGKPLSGGHTVTFIVTDDNNGHLTAAADSSLVMTEPFTNTYSSIGEGTIEVVKDLTGRDWKSGDSFTFTLTAGSAALADGSSGTSPMPEGSSETGTFVIVEDKQPASFGTITFRQAGTYTYTITETAAADNGITYDVDANGKPLSGGHTVTLIVADDGFGHLVAENGEPPVMTERITNTYAAIGEGEILVQKDLIGRDWFDGDSFTFTLAAGSGTDANGEPADPPMPETATLIVSDGDPVSFGTFTFKQAGAFEYTVKETPGSLGGVTYDSTTYTVTFIVEDNGKGSFIATSGTELIQSVQFTNTYEATGEGAIEVEKILSGRSWLSGDSFEFTLAPASDNAPMPEDQASVTRSVDNETAGHKASFGTITFTEAGTYTYTVTESKGSLGGLTYDTDPHTVTFIVVDDHQGNLIADSDTQLIRTVPLTNTYEASAGVLLSAEKAMDPWPESQSFIFDLDGDAAQTVTVTKEDPIAVFGTFVFTLDDLNRTFTYTVSEEHPADAKPLTIGGEDYWVKDGIGYSADTRTYTVVVSGDNGDGTLALEMTLDGSDPRTATVTLAGEDGTDIEAESFSFGTFNNAIYHEGTVAMSVTKDVTGAHGWPSGTPTFTFELKPAEGDEPTLTRFPDLTLTAIATKEEPTGPFDPIEFSEEDRNRTYTFTLAEVIPADAEDDKKDGVTYDTATYTVVISLDDDLTPTVTVDGEEKPADKTVFSLGTIENSYQVTPTSIIFGGRKRMIGMSMNPGQFSFTLTHPDGTTETVTNKDGGAFTFEEIFYDTEGTFTYTVIEEDTKLEGVKYDNTVYTITVTVTDGGYGSLKATLEGDVTEPDQIVFINRISDKGKTPPPEKVLPKTGFSALHTTALPQQPKALNYRPLRWRLEIPTLSVSSEIVEVPSVGGEYEVTWLGNDTGLLQGSALPGEGRVLLTGHNHLNTMEAGPFALLDALETGDRLFVTDPDGNLQIFEVYMNTKIGETDFAGLWHISETNDKSMTLITCEDERPDGSYENRRIVAARPIR